MNISSYQNSIDPITQLKTQTFFPFSFQTFSDSLMNSDYSLRRFSTSVVLNCAREINSYATCFSEVHIERSLLPTESFDNKSRLKNFKNLGLNVDTGEISETNISPTVSSYFKNPDPTTHFQPRPRLLIYIYIFAEAILSFLYVQNECEEPMFTQIPSV